MINRWGRFGEVPQRLGPLSRGQVLAVQVLGPLNFAGQQAAAQGRDPAPLTRAACALVPFDEELAGLDSQLAQSQADRDRWYQQAASAQETYLRDMAAMRELVAREQHIALRAATSPDAWTDNGRTDPDVTADGHEATVHEAAPAQEPAAESDSLDTLSTDTLAPSWRRWWRRATGGS